VQSAGRLIGRSRTWVHQIQRKLLWGDREGDRIARVFLLRVAAIDGEDSCVRRLWYLSPSPSARGVRGVGD
jgi:hypothetical protein